MYIKLNTNNFKESKSIIADFEKIWKNVITEFPFEGKFLDDHYESLYQSESRFMKIILVSSILSIFIACLGLFGISMYIAEKRTKEIGIKKVNGARIIEILTLINEGFLVKIIAAFIIACPLMYYLMTQWLSNFAYKITLSWWIFIPAGLLVLLLATVAVSWQSWRVARKNPVEALRYE